ncbi:citrate/2-methylcitrate synthase [Jiangella sp. DSM 45060]|uniref:citrate/2-methylcitrate synthase n=1 Tax=Jiangella sp. DSM 45060 TaxID=1798224 RepID=UPI00087BBB34|nr:citrate/2-methylcitrate synthase [Jiangella sp. DSM 45060]SDS03566.1 Citrate synthase [Jiangella sp. DSM 45060]
MVEQRRLTTQQVAARLGIKPETVYAYVSRGLLGSRRGAGGRASTFDPDEVERLARRRRGRPDAGSAAEREHDAAGPVYSGVTLIEGDRYYYRGVDPVELARRTSFEAVAWWLWTGQERLDPPFVAPSEGLAAARAAGDALPPQAGLVDRLRVAAVAAATVDPVRFDLRPGTVAATARGLIATFVDALPRRDGRGEETGLDAPGRGGAAVQGEGEVTGRLGPGSQVGRGGRAHRGAAGHGDPVGHRGATAGNGDPLTHGSRVGDGGAARHGGPAAHGSAAGDGHPMTRGGRVGDGGAARHGGPAAHGSAAGDGHPTTHGGATDHGTTSDQSGTSGEGEIIAERLWPRLTDRPAGPYAVHILDRALVLLIDHGLAASTVTARAAASARAHPYAVVSAALGAAEGPLHGGASGLAHRMLTDVLERGAGPVVAEHLRAGRRIPGLGHRLYRTTDPRAQVLFERLAAMPEAAPALAAARAVTETAATHLPLPANVDLALATLTVAAGMPPEAGEAIFTVARTAGWIAHALEEYDERALRVRVTGRYEGPPPPQPLPALF